MFSPILILSLDSLDYYLTLCWFFSEPARFVYRVVGRSAANSNTVVAKLKSPALGSWITASEPSCCALSFLFCCGRYRVIQLAENIHPGVASPFRYWDCGYGK
jgi:hypothetical protein